MKYSFKRGFTLIELLVVIAVIGVLAAVILASLNDARVKARDAKRLADIKQFQNALELYRNDNGAYPITNEWSYDSGGSSAAWVSYWTPRLVTPGYIASVMIDPINNASSHYRFYSNLTTAYTCAGRVWQDYEYVIAFRMEKPLSSIADSTYSPFTKCIAGPLK